jgi:uncharacterized protein (TIGR03435 family)
VIYLGQLEGAAVTRSVFQRERTQPKMKRNFLLTLAPTGALLALIFGGIAPTPLRAQSIEKAPQWQVDAGGKAAFDMASVKLHKSAGSASDDKPNSTVPLDASDAHAATSGELTATNFTLLSYIGFAYKLSGKELGEVIPTLPKWAITDHFDVEARAAGNPTKDQMRLMMQALLADRFKMAIHYDARQVPVFGFTLATPGTTGPQLHQHVEGSPCSAPTRPRNLASDPPPLAIFRGGFPGFPAICGGFAPLGALRAGARNVTMEELATLLNTVDGLNRPLMDQTGLSGTYDFVIEFAPRRGGPPLADGELDESLYGFAGSMNTQLGLKLEATMGPVDVLVIDHVEPLAAH